MHKNNKMLRFTSLLVFLSCFSLAQKGVTVKDFTTVTIGAQQFDAYLPLLKNKRVGIVTNITGVIGSTSIVDTLLKLKVNVKKIFGPEHGFRSNTEAGELVKSNKDKKTGLPVISLYGANKKPTKEQLKNIDVLIYDIQDVGVRFYTYISTMTYAMEACAENCKQFIVLDRPNPNGFYIDGPVLQPELKSFLGIHAVPIVYGMTCGEYATMANEEGWLKDSLKCDLKVISLKNYDRNSSYSLPVKPSPNIPNAQAVLLYPSLGLFEGTIISLGRGTLYPFQVIGHPKYSDSSFYFIPEPGPVSASPRYVGQKCYGLDLREENVTENHPHKIELKWLKMMYNNLREQSFIETNFNYHVGNKILEQQIKENLPAELIRASWKTELDAFKKIRGKYLLYPDFD